MHIMSTGTIKAHTGEYKRPPIQFHIQPHDEMRDILVSLGHTVEVRAPVMIGDPIPPNIDLIIFNMMSPTIPAAGEYAMSFLWTMYQAHHQGVPVIYFLGDWNSKQIDSSMSLISRSEDAKFLRTWSSGDPFYKDPPDLIIKHVDEIREAARGYITPGSDYLESTVTLTNRFTNVGDPEILRVSLLGQPEIFTFDYTPYVWKHVDRATLSDQPHRERGERWLVPGLHTHESWINRQKVQWPVDLLGQRKAELKRVYEHEVCEYMGGYRGTLSPEYAHAGSGWHRMRFIYAAVNKTFIWPGEMDFKMFSPDLDVVTAREYEMLSDEHQEDLAQQQSHDILSRMVVDSHVTMSQMKSAVDAAASRR